MVLPTQRAARVNVGERPAERRVSATCDGARWIDAVPGDYVYVPLGGIHAYRNESGAPVSMLLHVAPGAPRRACRSSLP